MGNGSSNLNHLIYKNVKRALKVSKEGFLALATGIKELRSLNSIDLCFRSPYLLESIIREFKSFFLL